MPHQTEAHKHTLPLPALALPLPSLVHKVGRLARQKAGPSLVKPVVRILWRTKKSYSVVPGAGSLSAGAAASVRAIGPPDTVDTAVSGSTPRYGQIQC